MADDAKNLLRHALELDDVSAAEAVIRAQPQLLNSTDSRPALTLARTVHMAERLLALGGDLDAVTKWWGRGIGLRGVERAVAIFLLERGARLTVHAAAGLGLVDPFEKMFDANPALIDAKGGDGCS